MISKAATLYWSILDKLLQNVNQRAILTMRQR